MKKSLASALLTLLIGVLFSNFAIAQDKRDNRIASAAGDVYVISAKAGGVNYVEGKVAVNRRAGKSGHLRKGDNLEIGDRVATAADGKAEILLNPGSYLRLGSNSEFEFKTTDLENLELKLNRGSAIFEVFANDEFKVTVGTPNSAFSLIESGIYRMDVNSENGTLSVWRGKVQLNAGTVKSVKSGKRIVFGDGQAAVAKFDRDQKDEFDNWSKLRAKDIAQLNRKLERKLLRNSLLNSYSRNGWGMYDSFGLWVYNASYGTHCFLPFGWGWRSPYGYGFGYDIWQYRLPSYIYNQPSYNNPSVVANPANVKRANIYAPPYERLQRAEGRQIAPATIDSNGDFGLPSSSGRSSSPASSPSSAPIRSSPSTASPRRSVGGRKTLPID